MSQQQLMKGNNNVAESSSCCDCQSSSSSSSSTSPVPDATTTCSCSASDTAVLVTAPRWRVASVDAEEANDNDLVEIENGRCQNVNIQLIVGSSCVGDDEEQDSSFPNACQSRKNFNRKRNIPFAVPFLSEWETNFGAKDEKSKEQELEARPISVVSPSAGNNIPGSLVGGFDICREYGYKYEYTVDNDDENDDDDKNCYDDSSPCVMSAYANGGAIMDGKSGGASVNDSQSTNYLLGKSYDATNDYALHRADETSLFWFTYRCDFPEIVPYRITSDAGWGCMLRSAQMLLAQTLKVHFLSRDYKPNAQSIASRRKDLFIRDILTWFADFPSTTDCIYSLHNMVAAGLSKYEKLPGEWYGPGTACYVLRDLVHVHEQQNIKLNRKQMFRVHVATQGSVFRDEIQELMTRTAKAKLRKQIKKQQKEQAESNNQTSLPHPLASSPVDSGSVKSSCFLHPLSTELEQQQHGNKNANAAINQHQQATESDVLEWDTALLLMIPLRLGLKTFNETYMKSLAYVFSLSQSVGVLGGRPRGARWYYGATSDGVSIFGLDPHTVQAAPTRIRSQTTATNQPSTPGSSPSSIVIDISEEYIRSIHTTYSDIYPMQKLDPSIALGFYCRNLQDFENLCYNIKLWKQNNPKAPELFSIADAMPNYSSNTSSVMKQMMGRSSSSNQTATDGAENLSTSNCDMLLDDDLDDDGVDNISDEDEYVML